MKLKKDKIMSEDFIKLKSIYNKLHDITVKININIHQALIEEAYELLNKRSDLVKESGALSAALLPGLSQEEKDDVNSLIAKIKEIENENIEFLKDKRNFIKNNLLEINKNQKVLSSYKVNINQDSEIFDSFE